VCADAEQKNQSRQARAKQSRQARAISEQKNQSRQARAISEQKNQSRQKRAKQAFSEARRGLIDVRTGEADPSLSGAAGSE
jgi:hypothetical protein